MKQIFLISILCHLALGQINFEYSSNGVNMFSTNLKPGQDSLSTISKPKPKKPQVESSGLIFGTVSSQASANSNALGLTWTPIKAQAGQTPEINIDESDSVTVSSSSYQKWECLWTSECNTPAAHLYCGKGCRAIHVTTKGQNKCFDGCCRCLRNTTEIPHELTQEYFIPRKLK